MGSSFSDKIARLILSLQHSEPKPDPLRFWNLSVGILRSTLTDHPKTVAGEGMFLVRLERIQGYCCSCGKWVETARAQEMKTRRGRAVPVGRRYGSH